MKIVVAVRCYNEEKNIERFLLGYHFADTIVVSDGGSTDGSLELLKRHPRVKLVHFSQQETVNGQTWNPDAPHINFVLDEAKRLDPDWLILDDMDDIPNWGLSEFARLLFSTAHPRHVQINAFRLYMWGEKEYFPYMNRNFDAAYTSLWAWKPKELDIRADPNVRHGTLLGLHPDPLKLDTPFCLLHKSWSPETVQAKIDRYNALGLPMQHPFEFAGKPEPLPEWAHE